MENLREQIRKDIENLKAYYEDFLTNEQEDKEILETSLTLCKNVMQRLDDKFFDLTCELENKYKRRCTK